MKIHNLYLSLQHLNYMLMTCRWNTKPYLLGHCKLQWISKKISFKKNWSFEYKHIFDPAFLLENWWLFMQPELLNCWKLQEILAHRKLVLLINTHHDLLLLVDLLKLNQSNRGTSWAAYSSFNWEKVLKGWKLLNAFPHIYLLKSTPLFIGCYVG